MNRENVQKLIDHLEQHGVALGVQVKAQVWLGLDDIEARLMFCPTGFSFDDRANAVAMLKNFLETKWKEDEDGSRS